MTLIKKGITYFRLHDDINNEDLLDVKLIPEVNKQIIRINFYFAHEGCRRIKNSHRPQPQSLKIYSKLKSFNLIITGDFNCNLE
jgi:hypothetical protein